MFKQVTRIVVLLAVLPAATSQEAGDLPVSEEPATNDAVEKTEEAVEAPPPKAPAAPSKAPAPPAKAASKATPPPAPPAPPVTPPVTPPVNPAVAAARRLEEDAQQQKDTLNRDFLDACRKSDTTKIEDLLRQGANIDDASQSGPRWSALAEAAVHGRTDTALYLLTKKASPDVEDNRGRTPLFHAVRYNHGNVVTEMLKTAKNLGSSDGDGVDMLTRAVWQEQTAIAQALLTAGAQSAAASKAAKNSKIPEIRKMFGFSETVPAPAAKPSAAMPSPPSPPTLFAGA